MSMLNALLAEDAVDLHGRARNWRKLLSWRAVCSLRREGHRPGIHRGHGAVGGRKRTVHCGRAASFAHARPSEAVRETALSWVRLTASGVRFQSQ